MKNMNKVCMYCNQEHAAGDKACSDGKPLSEIGNKETPSSDPRMSRDADNGSAIVSGHAEEG
jgi:hypothetical protein